MFEPVRRAKFKVSGAQLEKRIIYCTPIRIQQHLTLNAMSVCGLVGHCQSNMIKPHTQS